MAPLLGQNADPLSSGEETQAVKIALEEVERLRNAGQYSKGLDLALEILDRANRLKNAPLTAEAHYQTGVLYNSMGNFEQARAHLEIGLSHARMDNLTKLEADLMVAQGIVEWKLGNLTLATQYLQGALAIRENMGDMASMANIGNNLGIIHFSLKQYPEAVAWYRQAIGWLGEEVRDRLRASLYSNLAESLMPQGQYEEAESYLFKALEIEKRENEPHAIAYTYLNLGELRSAQGRPEEAISLFTQALDLQLSIEALWPAALTRIRIARQHMQGGDTDRALEVLAPGFELAKGLNALSLLRDYAEVYTEIYTVLGEEGMARYYKDLQLWFSDRVEEPLPKEPEIRRPQPLIDGSTLDMKSRELTSAWIRIATLALLAILIAFLMVENMRLRKIKTPPHS